MLLKWVIILLGSWIGGLPYLQNTLNYTTNINDITVIININILFSVFHVRFIEDDLKRKVREDVEFI